MVISSKSAHTCSILTLTARTMYRAYLETLQWIKSCFCFNYVENCIHLIFHHTGDGHLKLYSQCNNSGAVYSYPIVSGVSENPNIETQVSNLL